MSSGLSGLVTHVFTWRMPAALHVQSAGPLSTYLSSQMYICNSVVLYLHLLASAIHVFSKSSIYLTLSLFVHAYVM